MNQTRIVPVIMCGGAGSRLWPISRADNPKQFHPIIGHKTLLEATLERVTGDHTELIFEPYVLMSSAQHHATIDKHRPQHLPCGGLIYEPCVRSTAPAVAVATRLIAETNPDAAVLMLPSDAHIANVAAFRRAIADGATAARQGGLVTFGIVPDRPETGYGYIRCGAPSGPAFDVAAFVEKPDYPTAAAYLADGGYFWNAGIFMFRPEEMIAEFKRQCPDIWASAVRAYEEAKYHDDAIFLAERPFAACRTESIDYAVLEGADRVKVVPVDMGWNDIGSWGQVYDVFPLDAKGNAIRGDVITVGAEGNLVQSERGLVALVGVENTAVLATEDATLIVRRDRAQDVKQVVEALKAGKRREHRITARASRIVRPTAELVPEIRQWLFDQALPFWAEVGLDHKHGGVIECLNLDGTPRRDDVKRLRVLARQIYVYAHAKLLGVDEPADLVIDHALAHLLTKGWHPDGGWIHLFTPEGDVKDAKRDAYDQAFVIFALAWAHRATGREDLRDWIDRTLYFMDKELADPVHGGYREAVPAMLPRRANPHMHFLEAMLAAWSATRERDFLGRAGAIVDLFQESLFDDDTWTLTEFFANDWHVAAGAPGRIAEPGHHYEWVWLLQRFEAHSGRDVFEHRRKLFATAEAFGRDHATGRVYDEMTKDGTPLTTSSRCWPQTEALKALLAMRENGADGLDWRIDETVAVLFDDYFGVQPAGSWMDRFAYRGAGIAETVPASTFYHAFSASAELLRAFDDPSLPAL